jgi:hypothetical protein
MTARGKDAFSLLRYLSLALLVAPLVLTALVWMGFVLRATFMGSAFNKITDPSLSWLTVALGAGVVCLMCEWLVLPRTLPHHHPRPRFTPVVSFSAGAAWALPVWLLLSGAF